MTTQPLGALRKLGITAEPDETFIVLGDDALIEVQTAFEVATNDLPAGHDWRMFAMCVEGDAECRSVWRCSVGQARENWPYPRQIMLP